MNTEQFEYRILTVIRETAKKHDVKVYEHVGELVHHEHGFTSHAHLSFRLNCRKRIQQIVLVAVVIVASVYGFVCAITNAGFNAWVGLDMLFAIWLHERNERHRLTTTQWDAILLSALRREGFAAMDTGDTLSIRNNIEDEE